jgi:hypothetical protein
MVYDYEKPPEVHMSDTLWHCLDRPNGILPDFRHGGHI